MGEPSADTTDFYADKSDIEIARFINLSLLVHNGISEQDAGFDLITSINDKGLAKLASIIRDVRAAAKSRP